MHPTLAAAQTIAKPYIDFVIRGEGEESARRLARILSRHGNGFEEVSGLAWKKNGQIFATPQGGPLDLDRLPPIPWRMVAVEEYVSPAHFMFEGVRRLLPFQGSRGCPFKCTFCSEPALTQRYRMMRPAKIVEECLEMTARYRLDHVVFFDEEFFVNRRWAMEIAEAIGGRFTWWAQTRAEDLLHVDLKKLERCGLRVVAPGLESGSDRVLGYIKKRETVADYKKANALLAQTRIQTEYNFIIGYPTETARELGETVDLVLDLLEANPRATVNHLGPLTPLPGTELLDQVKKEHGFSEPSRLEGWIQWTRGRQEKPWLDPARLKTIRFLYYTSYFLCSAGRLADKLGIPRWIFRIYGATIRWRWRRKFFWMAWEIPFLRLLFRWFVNPVDYRLPENYGDAFSAADGGLRVVEPLTKSAPIRAPLGLITP